ncbi:MAG TPA: acyl-CoA dehydrogenase [Mycobacteriales bacterium]|jgi:alkylation response protein AidB-like acyl-CoA dehydrogenase|nr:acyl-CoA dehydrogenase [Mycobacteriales bacterium]
MFDTYAPPLTAIRASLDRVLRRGPLHELPGFGHADLETMTGVLAEFGRFCAEVIAPLNRSGDAVGASYDPGSGRVTTPPGWREAYAQYVRAGWGSVPFRPEFGGGGFPWLLAVAMQEILASANMAFSLCPMLTQGAVEMLTTHGSPQQQGLYLSKLVTGEWTATMNLTEPQAGSDVGALTTRARPVEDGSWRVSGHKIFITYGEHDLAENIVHLVLARAPGAPAGSRGISVFIVPQFLPAADGSPGERNAVRCTGIEHKMGIHAAPTCSLEFDDAIGFLIGELNTGMRVMFTMMNNARLSVGLEGLGVAERAYQAAVRYARERVQGRPVGQPGDAPIVEHPDVRRMLLHIRAHIDAMRALAYTNGWAIDQAHAATSEQGRRRGQELADLLTPASKAWCTDLGSELTRLATQVHGGAGYITDTGVEQHERDVRIAAIYEGTNGIQAIDLVSRKLPLRDGAAIGDLFDMIDVTAARLTGELADLGSSLTAALGALRAATDWLLARHGAGPAAVLAAATPYLRQYATVLGGWLLAEQALTPTGPADLAAARYYGEQVLPLAAALLPAVTAGAEVLYDLSVESFER